MSRASCLKGLRINLKSSSDLRCLRITLVNGDCVYGVQDKYFGRLVGR